MPGISQRDQVSTWWMPVSGVTGFAHEVLPGNPGTGAGGPAAPVLAGMELIHSGLRCRSGQRTACAVDVSALGLARPVWAGGRRPDRLPAVRVGTGRLLCCLARGRSVVVMPGDPLRAGHVYQRRVRMVSR